MKLGFALAFACLAGSVVFHFVSGCSEPELPAVELVSTETARDERSPWSGPAREPPPSASLAEAAEGDEEEAPEELEDLDEALEEKELDGEALLAGQVWARSGVLPEGVVVFLQPKSIDGDPQELAEAGDEEAASEEDPLEIYQDAFAVEEDGQFEFYVAPGEYRLVARVGGHLPAVLDGLRVSAGERLSALSLELDPGESIRGVVLAEGEPLDGVSVVAEGNGFFRSTIAAEDGTFEISGLPPGRFSVRAFEEAYGSDEEQVDSGRSVSLRLERAERLRGRVIDERGAPIAGAQVYAIERSPDEGRPERDPFGESEPEELLGVSGCGPMPSCREIAQTDSGGFFDIPRARGSSIQLAAAWGELRSPVQHFAAEREVIVPLRRVAPVLLELSGGSLLAQPRDQGGGLAAQLGSESLVPDAQGRVTVRPWPGVPIDLTPSKGAQVRVVGRLAHDVSLRTAGVEQWLVPY